MTCEVCLRRKESTLYYWYFCWGASGKLLSFSAMLYSMKLSLSFFKVFFLAIDCYFLGTAGCLFGCCPASILLACLFHARFSFVLFTLYF
jgi:hypothetical protein